MDQHAAEYMSDGMLNLKILATNSQCGMLIGRGGAKIKELQDATQSHIKISHSSELYPDTPDRIVLVRAQPEHLLNAAVEVIKCANSREFKAEQQEDQFSAQYGYDQQQYGSTNANARIMTVKLVIPVAVAGVLIGRGGETIRTLQNETGAFINISQRDEVPSAYQERLVTISSYDGSLPVYAIERILAILIEHADIFVYQYTSFSYMGRPAEVDVRGRQPPPPGAPFLQTPAPVPAPAPFVGGQRPPLFNTPPPTFTGAPGTPPYPHQPPGSQPPFHPNGSQPTGDFAGFPPSNPPQPFGFRPPFQLQPGQIAVAIPLDDMTATMLLDRGAALLHDIMMRSGTQMQVSPDSDYSMGPQPRLLNISGYPAGVELAQQLLDQAVSNASRPRYSMPQQRQY
eukprot:m.7682 g.7682  ORF g.7682 m.7682 type:complete len:399 (+) comp5278_c0_seq1:178-1374(+)